MTALAPLAALLLAAPAPRWSAVLDATALARTGLLSMELELAGLPGTEQLCADMTRASRYVRELRLAGGPALAADPEDPDCFDLPAVRPEPLRVTWLLDLKELAARTGDPDWATQLGGDFVFSDSAVLLRPDPLPPGQPVEIEVRLAPGDRVTAPWTRLEGKDPARARFLSSSRQHEAGSYVALGKLTVQDDLPVRGGTLGLTLLSTPFAAPAAVVRGWVGGAGRAVADFYGGIPGGRVQVVLVPVPGRRQPGSFGTVLSRGAASAVLFFGADAPAESFPGSWLPFHELFHAGNPRVTGKPRWFLEGTATYYQDVLRARAGARTRQEMWDDLWDGLRRYCDPARGLSLREESRQLPRSHRWMEVYWGAACLLFRADVAIREQSGNARSLDDVLRELRRRSEQAPLDEDALVAALDAATGGLAGRLLDATAPVPGMEPLLKRLGLEPADGGTVRLADAPLSALRDSILAPQGRAQAATSRPRSSGSPR